MNALLSTPLTAIPLQDTSREIWGVKYQLKAKDGRVIDEEVDDTFKRVAGALAKVEDKRDQQHWYQRFVWALRNGAIPAGRIMSNAGAEAHKPATSTINCTVSKTINDSMDGILSGVYEAGITLAAGCGIGYDFTTLRPRGAFVAGVGAYTSGAISFMGIYDAMCFTVASAGGRRGAQMGTLQVSHPDVLEFIKAKREDGRLRQFNLSLLITDEFMAAVNAGEDFPTYFPLNKKEPSENIECIWREWPAIEDNMIVNDQGLVKCRVYSRINARELWATIMKSTYDFAEPGFILIDKYNEYNNNWFCENIRTTNPCVTADTWVHTSEGPRQVAELIGRPFRARVDGVDHASGAEGFFLTAHKPVVALRTREGHALRLTADHRVRRVTHSTRWVTQTQWCAAGELAVGDRVLLNDHRANTEWDGPLDFGQGYLLGLLVGDGTLKQDAAVLSAWPAQAVANGDFVGPRAGIRALMIEAEKAALALPHRSDFKGWTAVSGRDEWRLSLTALRDLAFSLGMSPGDKEVTPALEKTSSETYRGFLRGFFDTDGSVQGSQHKGVSVRLSQSNLARLEAVQRMLLRLGITSTIYANRRAAGTKVLPNGKGGSSSYPTQAQHELVISGEGVQQYAEQIGFADSDKGTRLTRLCSAYQRAPNRQRFIATVASVTPVGESPVYDVQVPGINTFDANGLHAHNCGEQGLPPYGACLLGSVNLTKFVTSPFCADASFDWSTFREVVAVFTRMLDNVVEINGLPLAQQREEIERKRRHGMGFMGLGSALAMLRMKYGSDEAVAFTKEVAKTMAIIGLRVGIDLAIEKGPAPIMEEEFVITPKMLRERPQMVEDGYMIGQKIKGKILLARYSKFMQRLGEVEPELVKQAEGTGLRFTHHSSIAPTGTISLSFGNNISNGIEPSFAHEYKRNVIREGKKTKDQVTVYSYEWLLHQTLYPAAQMPDYFCDTNNISPMQHVRMQAAAQLWVDSSISKTINVPTGCGFVEFEDIYAYAYSMGLKGCTTFRFNPEAFQGVLVKDEDLANTTYVFKMKDGSTLEFKGNEMVEYEGNTTTAANLFDALKEGYYGKF